MFEIRIICDPRDEPTITTALNNAFHTSTHRSAPTRDGKRTRLYLTAMTHQEAENAYIRRIREESGDEAACLAADAIVAANDRPENL